MTQQTRLDTWFEEVWHQGSEEAVKRLLDSNAVIHGLEVHKDYKGHDAFLPYFQKFKESFPSVHVDMDHLINTNDMEAAFCHVNATTADGKKVHFDGIVITKYKDGKIVEAWNAFDFLSMYQQLGMSLTPEEQEAFR